MKTRKYAGLVIVLLALGVVHSTNAQDDDWQWIDTGFNTILLDIEFPEGQNQIGYAVGETLTYKGEGVVIKTVDGGDAWTQLTPDGIPGLECMSFVDVNTGYAAGWDGYMIKTTDGGVTWDTLEVASDIWLINDIEFIDANQGVLFEDEHVYTTQDGGYSWAAGTGITHVCLEVDYADPNTLFAVGYDNSIFKSVDGGDTWATVHAGAHQELLLGVNFLDPNHGTAVGDYSMIMNTTDGGDTWNYTPLIGDMLLKSAYMWDVNTTYTCGTPEYVFKTTDGGESWFSDYDGTTQRAFNRITFTDNRTGFICGSGGVVLRKAGLEPLMGITPDSIVFEDTVVGRCSCRIMTISNTGNATLEVSDITSSLDEVIVSKTSFSVEPGHSQDVIVFFVPDEPGMVEGTLELVSNDDLNGPSEIEVTGQGLFGDV
jgi:photosystem II stability/assembly factor-like uncharacterized protein